MPFFDMPLEKLRTFQMPDYQPADLDAFWSRTLAEASQFPLDARFEKLEEPYFKLVEAYDVTFAGFGGHPIKGWFVRPAGATGKLPCVVSYIGYGGGRALAIEHLSWATAGYANLVMDTRGQGAGWSPGGTADPVGSGPFQMGFMVRGIESPDSYYYRRVFTDAARAVDVAAAHPGVDASRVAVTGGSQGGGIAIAAAALAGRKVKLAMPDVPFLCAFRRAADIIDTAPYNEISNYLKVHRHSVKSVFDTLAYFDGVNLASRITARCLFSVGLMDTTCPPSTIFAAYNRLSGPKEICVYEFNNHEGGGVLHHQEKLRFAAKHL